MSTDEPVVLGAADLLRWQEAGCQLASSPSAFYAALLGRSADDTERGDAAVASLLERAPMTIGAAPPLRMMGGLHRGVLTGEFAALAAAWPAPDGTGGDPDRAYEEMRRLVADPPASLLDAMTRDPQTNEVGRSAALAAGLATIGAETGLPIRLFEIGASAGLNLRLDHYAYSVGGHTWGDRGSPLQFDDTHYEGTPPFDGTVVVAERRGCDLHPIDATTPDGATTLLSYVWPDQAARITRLRAALAVAREQPVVIDRASADDWVAEHVVARTGAVTVLMHSVMWQYMPAAVQQAVEATMHDRGSRATEAAPVAWLSVEPSPRIVDMDVSVTVFPGGARQVLGACGGHGPPVRWTPDG